MKASPESAKKAYSTPTLSKYGDLAAMTSSASKAARNMDGGNNKLKS
jgi:hypothetical protein